MAGMAFTDNVLRLYTCYYRVFEIVPHNFKSGSYYEIVDRLKETVVSGIHSESDNRGIDSPDLQTMIDSGSIVLE